MLASTWDQELVYNVGKVIGNEALEYGVDVLLGQGMNIQRNPLCGRNYEYYSEDPLVTGKIAAAMVNGIQSNGVGASIKHFAANNQETQRFTVNTVVSERALREIYLKGFEIAVREAQPWTVMSSYNKINGTYTSQSYDLLTKILRDDWDFQGYVVTDWGGGDDVVEQVKAGNDVIMPGSTAEVKKLVQAVNEGNLSESVLDTSLERFLGIMMKSPKYRKYENSDNPDLKSHASVTRQAAADGMVLLKNDNGTLPVITSDLKVAVFGNSSYDIISGGIGSGDVQEAYTISLLEGLVNSALKPDQKLEEMYKTYMKETSEKLGPTQDLYVRMRGGKVPLPEMPVSKTLAGETAGSSDMALITIGRNSGEGSDREVKPGDFLLDQAETDMIKNVTEAFHSAGKKVLVVLNIGGVIETVSWRDYPDAILCAWLPGQEAGNSIADVITGKVNPSGKLAVTFPVKYEDCPSASSFPGYRIDYEDESDRPDVSGFSFSERVPWEVVYEEGIFVGYRYYNTYDVPVAYEFGYGLSYTTFEYGDLKPGSPDFDGSMTVTVDVENTGQVSGREIVQLYVSAPEGFLEKPEDELVAFAKTKLLQPGDTETVTMSFTSEDLASFDESSSSWIVEPGTYILKVGASSIKIKQTATFEVPEKVVAGKVSRALAPEN